MNMADYKTMYLLMMRATTKAIDLLIGAQRQCEELYIKSDEKLVWLPQRGVEKDENAPESGGEIRN